jgi:hypothetical protein
MKEDSLQRNQALPQWNSQPFECALYAAESSPTTALQINALST